MNPQRILSFLGLAALLTLTAPLTHAGTSAPALISPIEEVEDAGLGFEAALGYDMRYYVRGFWFANHSAWASLAYSKPQSVFILGICR
jgi:hypothetical protein